MFCLFVFVVTNGLLQYVFVLRDNTNFLLTFNFFEFQNLEDVENTK